MALQILMLKILNLYAKSRLTPNYLNQNSKATIDEIIFELLSGIKYTSPPLCVWH